MKKFISLALCAVLILATLTACGTASKTKNTYTIGLCNYVNDASLNQIVENIQSQLAAIGKEKGVTFDVKYQNCNADNNVLNQIVSNFIADDVDLMVGVATPVAMAMQNATEGKNLPVVFSAVTDPWVPSLLNHLKLRAQTSQALRIISTQTLLWISCLRQSRASKRSVSSTM